jgi:hypothetical protein
LYQYQFAGAKDILMGMIQTESPYYQVTPKAPAPFRTGLFASDPTFSDCTTSSKTCAVSWAVRIIDSKTIYMLGAGMYSWFSDYSQKCLETENCQDRGLQIEESEDIWLFNLVTKAIVEMVSPTDLLPTYAKDNKNGYCSSILAWLRGSDKTIGRRHFSGFHLYEPAWLINYDLPKTCKTALLGTVLCDDFVRSFNEAKYWGSLNEANLTESVCDPACGQSLKMYYENVATSCAGLNITGAEPTKVGGVMWEAWNETCVTDRTSGKYCNGKSTRFHLGKSLLTI